MASYIVNYMDWKDAQFLGYLHALEEDPKRYHRKPWEFVRILQSLDAAGVLHEKAIGLGLGCGDERLMYVLAKHCLKVVASDLYDLTSIWSESRMLPALLYDACPLSTGYPRERLEIKAMNMLHGHLMYPAHYFDYVWSTSSIEHLSNQAELEALFRSINSVLKPGGCFVFATEWHVGGPFRNWPHLNLFEPRRLTQLARSGCFEIVVIFKSMQIR